MNTIKRAVAAAELLLISPAALFMAALLVRNVTPLPKEPAQTAQLIVMWYSHLPVHLGLWGLLIMMPLAVLILGCGTLLYGWTEDGELREAARQTLAAIRAHLAMFVVAAATVTSAGILAFIAVHVLTD
ncbi:MAG: hypothetical protein HY047_06595 [Acidobacteria bacterium]|nr:hypothetical protein [Acidobacteriota bacterium]